MESAEKAAIATSQSDDIVTLGKGEKDIPESVGVQVVDDALTVWIDLAGIIDYKVAIQRLNKTLKSAKGPLGQLECKMKADGYEEKVPEALKVSKIEKLPQQTSNGFFRDGGRSAFFWGDVVHDDICVAYIEKNWLLGISSTRKAF